MEIILGLIVVLGVIAVIGHGIWVLIANLGKMLFETKPSTPAVPQGVVTNCPQCRQQLLSILPGCPHCGHRLPVRYTFTDQVKLQVLLFQIEGLAKQGLISQPMQQRLIEQLQFLQPATSNQTASPVATAIDSAPTVDQDRITRWAEKQIAPSTPTPRPAAVAPVAPPLTTTGSEALPLAIKTPIPAPIVPTPTPPATPFAQLSTPTVSQPSVAASTKPIVPQGSWEQAILPEPVRAAKPVKPSVSWSEWLAGFMEQRHIRWGELIGGLLIVCCSMVLVISFWNVIAELPWMQYALFNGVTAGIFALGLYSEKRWKLEYTSRGLLIIASLLVPLIFLAIAAFSSRGGLSSGMILLGEVGTSILFAGLLYAAGQVLFPSRQLLLLAAIFPAVVSLLLIRRGLDTTTNALAAQGYLTLPVLAYAGLAIWWSRIKVKPTEAAEDWLRQTFRLFGISTFATATAISFHLLCWQPVGQAWSSYAFLTVVLAIPALLYGVMLWQRLVAKEWSTLRTIGLSFVLFGVGILVVAQVMAIPVPTLMMCTALSSAVVILIAGQQVSQPWAHLPAAVLFAWGGWLGSLHLTSDITQVNNTAELIKELLSVRAGWSLVPITILTTIVTGWFVRTAEQIPTKSWGIVTGLTALASLLLVGTYGLGVAGDPAWVTVLFGAYTVLAAVAARRFDSALIAGAGVVLLFLATIQGIMYASGVISEESVRAAWAIILFAALAMLIGVVSVKFPVTAARVLLSWTWHVPALITTLLLGLALCRVTSLEAWSNHWPKWLCILLIWSCLALHTGARWIWGTCQAMLVIIVTMISLQQIQTQAWYQVAAIPGQHPWLWQIITGVWLVLGAIWFGCRQLAQRNFGPGQQTHTPEIIPCTSWAEQGRDFFARSVVSLDQVVLGWGASFLLWCVAGMLAPAVVRELAPATSNTATISYLSAETTPTLLAQFSNDTITPLRPGAWILWLFVSILTVWKLWREPREWLGWVALFLLPLMLALVISWLAPVHAVVTMSRWLATLLVIIAAVVIVRQPRWLLASDGTTEHSATPTSWWQESLPGNWPWQVFRLHSQTVLALGGLLIVIGQTLTLAFPPAAVMHQALFSVTCLGIMMLALGTESSNWIGRILTTMLCLAGIVLITPAAQAVWLALQSESLNGPLTNTIWSRLPRWLSYSLTLGLAGLSWCAIGWRKHTAPLAFLAAMLWTVGWFVGAVLYGQTASWSWDIDRWLGIISTTTIAGSIAALIWYEALTWDRKKYQLGVVGEPSQWLSAWTLFPLVSQLAMLIPAGFWLFAQPVRTTGLEVIGSPWGWLSFGLSFVMLLRVHHLQVKSWKQVMLPVMIGASGILLAGTAQRWGWDNGNWLGFHFWQVATVVMFASWLIQGYRLAAQTNQHLSATQRPLWMWWSMAFAAVVLILGVRTLDRDPQHPVWSVTAGSLATLGLIAAAWLIKNRNLLSLAGATAWLVSLVLIDYLIVGKLHLFSTASLCSLCLAVPIWYYVDELIRTHQLPDEVEPFRIRWYRLATILGMVFCTLIVGGNLAVNSGGFRVGTPSVSSWMMLVAVGVALLTLCWDKTWTAPGQLLYWWGLLICGQLLCSWEFTHTMFAWGGLLILAAYGVGTSYLWTQRAKFPAMFRRHSIADRTSDDAAIASPGWLISINSLLATLVLIGATVSQFQFEETGLRLGAAKAGLAQSVSLGLLAWGRRRSLLQLASLATGSIGLILIGWSFVLPTGEWLLNYSILAMAALIGSGVLYGFGFTKILSQENDWTTAAKRLVPSLFGMACCLFGAVLVIELIQFAQLGQVKIAIWGILIVAVCLLVLIVAALLAALLPGRDPWNLPEQRRGLYVYIAEGIMALFFLHIRICCPWLFTGLLSQYWPLIIMAIAFLGVGLGEYFRREKQFVLGEPLANTGIFLPLLAVLGMLFTKTQVHMTLLLVLCAGVYSVLALRRRSFGFGAVALLFANGGFWYWLQHDLQRALLEHPQLWLIPPALCVLVAAQLNRARLSANALATLRYGSLSMIYISSTAQIFMDGVKEHPLLPLLLAGLSITGIALGMFLRVRSFLWLGTGFLVVSLLTMIYHAAVNLEQTWIWAASGIVAGVAIIAVFAVFEKKRQEILHVLEKLQGWDE